MVRNGDDFVVHDARDGADIAASILDPPGTVAAPLVTMAGSLHKTVACFGKNAYFERT
jgi:hypothetical protein